MPELLHTAAAFAVEAHKGVDRKSSVLPYVTHPFEVAKQLTRWGEDDEALIAAAFLHDTVEDVEHVTSAMIREQFGQRVAYFVDAVTWPDHVVSKADKYDHLVALVAADGPLTLPVLLLKAADRICNVRDYRATTRSREYARQYALMAYPIYRGLIARNTPGQPLNPVLMDDLNWIWLLVQGLLPAGEPWSHSVDAVRSILFPE